MFNATLDEQERVEFWQRQFNGMERGFFRGGSALFNCYRYRIAFSLDGRLVQTYTGSSNVGSWLVEENGERGMIHQPRLILASLHASIGMPV